MNRRFGLSWLVAGSALALVLFVGGLLAVRVVDQGEACAIVRLGKVVGVAEPGMHFRLPLVTSYDCYSTQQQIYQTAAGSEGNADFLDFPVEIKTGDGQTAQVLANTKFQIPPENVVRIRSEIGNDMEAVIRRVVAHYARSEPRNLAPNYSATQLYGLGRNDYAMEIYGALQEAFEANGIELVSFEIRDIDFDPLYEETIEQQQIAREQIERAQFEAQSAVYEAQRTAELAKGEAQATIERAKGEAEAQKIEAAAEAEAIKLKGEALNTNPSVLQLEFVQQLSSAEWMMVPWENVEGFLPLQPQSAPSLPNN